MKWNGKYSSAFKVKRGTKQGSILSPALFNVFINDLLIGLSLCKAGVRINNDIFNSFAYADDINLFSLTVPDLQCLIDMCWEYSRRWRFSFGIKKSRCMISGGNNFLRETPSWYLKDVRIDIVNQVQILGTAFSSPMSSVSHVNQRAQACRRAMYSLSEVGCSYPGLSTHVKCHLWRSVGLPTLLFGCDTIHVNKTQLNKLEAVQATTVKRVLGLPVRSHHSKLLQAVEIYPVEDRLKANTKSLWWRTFRVASPARTLCARLLGLYIADGTIVSGSLLDRVVKAGSSPVALIFNKPVARKMCHPQDGVVDSLSYLVMQENFIKPYSEEHVLATLLLRAF